VKRSQLGVPEETLREHGAVSAETAVGMATGVRQALHADVAVSVTGVAGPGGGTEAKPVGLVYVCVEWPNGEETEKLQLGGSRDAIRSEATAAALRLLERVLSRSATKPGA
jgi:PncC family amidohydrolase